MNKDTLVNFSQLIFTGATKKIFKWESEEGFTLSTRIIQGKSITSYGEVDWDNIETGYMVQGNIAQRQLLQHGDVLVLARGSDMRAAFVSKNVADLNCVASSNFIIIRPNKEKLCGEVIVSYLNSTQGILQLKQPAQSAAIENITLNKLKKLTIPIPSQDDQALIQMLFNARNAAYKATINYAEQQLVAVSAKLENLLTGLKND